MIPHNKGKKFPAEALKRGEAERLMRAAANPNNYGAASHPLLAARTSAILHLMWRCGLRSNETLSLRRCDIDLEERTLRVMEVKGSKRGSKPRILGMDVLATSALKRWLRYRKLMPLEDGQLLFVTAKLNKIPGQIVRAQVKRLALYANLRYRRVHLHMLRHTFATERVIEGKKLSFVKSALGHKSFVTTMVYIDHLAPVDCINEMRELQ